MDGQYIEDIEARISGWRPPYTRDVPQVSPLPMAERRKNQEKTALQVVDPIDRTAALSHANAKR
jgi:hypothetical protein